MNIYEKVSTICKERKISQEELEKQAGLGRRTIYNWKKSAPSAENLFRVSKALIIFSMRHTGTKAKA